MKLVAGAASLGLCIATPAWAAPFVFSTGTPDGLIAALSQPATNSRLETETADDFILGETTSISQATVTGLIAPETPVGSIIKVEVEIYHVFPKDSVDPVPGHVPSRANSPGDVEIDSATRDSSVGTLSFSAALLDDSFSVLNSVVDGVHAAPDNATLGDGPTSGEVVQITITFDPPIVLPAEHYFFRPQVQLVGGDDFLFLSAPKPIVPPGTPFVGDLQAWIRNSELKPDWLRIGTDIIAGTPVQTFNMALSLSGETVGQAETPTPTATPTGTATPPATATATVPPSSNGNGGCNLSDEPSLDRRSLGMQLSLAAALWFLCRRRLRSGADRDRKNH